MAKPNLEGRIFKSGTNVCVEKIGSPGLSNLSGVECLNQTAPEEDRIYRKTFYKKPIFMPSEYHKAIAEILVGSDVVVIGMNGYSSLSLEQCQAWGVKPGTYEAACHTILKGLIEYLTKKFNGIDVRIAHGASDLGVDRAAIRVGRQLNCPQLGHSCPKFMFYVPDDEIPVYVAKTQAEYAQAFIRSLNVLIAANGRVQAFEHDIDTAFKLHKPILPINVLKSISSTGGPPAFNANGGIEDAVAAMEQLVFMVSMRLGLKLDQFEELRQHTNETVAMITRRLLSPERAFGDRLC